VGKMLKKGRLEVKLWESKNYWGRGASSSGKGCNDRVELKQGGQPSWVYTRKRAKRVGYCLKGPGGGGRKNFLIGT